MKSKLFRQFDLSDEKNKAFSEDLAALLTLTIEQWQVFLTNLSALLASRTQYEREQVLEHIEAKTGLARTVLSRVYSQARFFMSAFREENIRDESPDLWAKDLVTADAMNSESQEQFVEFISLLKDVAFARVEALQRERRAETGVLPSLKGIGTSVELRGVLKEEYEWGKPVEEYDPKIEGLIPVVSVAIKVDSGTPDRFVFQAASDEILFMINELQSALKSVLALKEHIQRP